MSKEILRIGVPSKGRIRLGCIDILRKKNFKIFSERGSRDLIGRVKNQPNLQILYMHSREILSNLATDNLDIGFSGFDLYKDSEINSQKKIGIIKRLNFAIAEVVIAIPEEFIDVYTTLDLDEVSGEFRKKNNSLIKIGTKYPNITRDFLNRKGVSNFEIIKSLGATELMPRQMKNCLCISDVTQTGSTLKANKLRILSDGLIMKTCACIFINKKSQNKKGIKNIIKLFSN